MKLVLKEGKTYQDPYDGEITTACAIVGEVSDNCLQHEANISVLIFRSAQAQENGKPPVDRKGFFVNSEDYDRFFLKVMLQMEGVTFESQAYAYLAQLKYVASITQDENGDDVKNYELVWGDWELSE